jgi:hypothetical protein
MWTTLFPSVDLISEFRFAEHRRFRFDFAHLPSMTAIEIEGGVWTGGRHTSGSGYTRDCEKYNLALTEPPCGWAVFRLTPSMITAANLDAIAETIERRALWLSISSPN